MTKQKWEERFDERFSNPNKLDSSSQFNKKYQGVLYGEIKQFIQDLIEDTEEGVVGEEKPISNQAKPVTEYEAVTNDINTGYNQKRQEVQDYFKSLKK